MERTVRKLTAGLKKQAQELKDVPIAGNLRPADQPFQRGNIEFDQVTFFGLLPLYVISMIDCNVIGTTQVYCRSPTIPATTNIQ